MVRFLEPADGATYTLPQGGQGNPLFLNVTLDDFNHYSDSTIEARGLEALSGEVQCTGGAGSQMTCQSTFNQNGGGGMGQSCMPSCSVTFVATRGDARDIRTVKFVRGGQTPMK